MAPKAVRPQHAAIALSIPGAPITPGVPDDVSSRSSLPDAAPESRRRPVARAARRASAAPRRPGSARVDWLAAGRALRPLLYRDLRHRSGGCRSAAGCWRPSFPHLAADIVVQAGAPGRRKALLVADMESTIIEKRDARRSSPDFSRPARGGSAEITRQAMNDEIDFFAAAAGPPRVVALLKGDGGDAAR